MQAVILLDLESDNKSVDLSPISKATRLLVKSFYEEKEIYFEQIYLIDFCKIRKLSELYKVDSLDYISSRCEGKYVIYFGSESKSVENWLNKNKYSDCFAGFDCINQSVIEAERLNKMLNKKNDKIKNKKIL